MADIADLTDAQIKVFIANYKAKAATHGGKWPLSVLQWEQAKRAKSEYEIIPLMTAILRLCRQSDDHRVSYGQLWKEMNDAPLPKGQAWAKPLTNSLGRVGAYCVDKGLPLLSTLVVDDQTRQLTDDAAHNIWAYMKDRGEDVGDSPRNYVDGQAGRAAEVVETQFAEPVSVTE